MHYHIVNFYEFVEISSESELSELRGCIEGICKAHKVLGTVLLTSEGANFGLSGKEDNLIRVVEAIKKQTIFGDFQVKWSWGSQKPYPKLKVKIQESTITFLGSNDPTSKQIKAGKRLTPSQWRNYLEDPNVVVVDTRNEYEVEWGKFQRANSLGIDKFSQFPEKFLDKYSDKKDKTFIMYCTGGIRCEKAVAWAQQEGFDKAYQLDGGIVGYFEKEGGEHYDGSCFVFDRRWAIDSQRQEIHTPPANNVRQPKQYFDAKSFDEGM